MNFNLKIGYITIFHPFEIGADKSNQVHEEGLELLRKSSTDYDIIKFDRSISNLEDSIIIGNLFKENSVDCIIIRLATWSSDELLLEIISRCNVPVINWGLKDINSGSMCGTHQFNAVLKELHKESIIIYEDTDESLKSIHNFSKICHILNGLKNARFGLIGIRTQGMAEIISDEYSIMNVFGSKIVSISLDSFKRVVSSKEGNQLSDNIRNLTKKVSKINITKEQLENSVKNYLTLKEFISRKKLSGITIGCYPNYMGETCVGFSLLSDEGIVCACEADLNSLILMYIMYNLSEQPVQHIDPLLIDLTEDLLIGSHCGSNSLSHAEKPSEISIENVRLANNGACLNFPSKSGIITMANLIGRKDSYRLCIIRAEAIPTKMNFPGNPIKIKFPFSIKKFVKVIEKWGFGHHWVIAYGNISEMLESIAELLNIKYCNFVGN